MKIGLYVDVVIRDKEGKVVKRLHKKCSSYVRQMIDLLRGQGAYASSAVKDTSGNSNTITWANSPIRLECGSASNAYGIQVGTGTGAVGISDYRLYPLIEHGTGAGQLQYGATSVGTVAIVGSTAQFTVARTFTNVSGADINVTEVGLVSLNATYYNMIERSLLTFTVGNGLSATVTYTIKVST